MKGMAKAWTGFFAASAVGVALGVLASCGKVAESTDAGDSPSGDGAPIVDANGGGIVDAADDFFGVRGRFVDRYTFDGEEQVVGRNLSGEVVEIWVEDDTGEFERFTGAGFADGSFSIPDVPEGLYYLRIPETTEWIHSDVREREIVVSDILGLPGTESSEGSGLALDLTGLVPWEEGDQLALAAPGRGWAITLPTPGGPLDFEDGQSAVDDEIAYQSIEGFSSIRPVPLLDDDIVYAAQLRERETANGVAYQTAARAFAERALAQADGELAAIVGALTATADESIELDVRGAAFADLVATFCPGEQVEVTLQLTLRRYGLQLPALLSAELPLQDEEYAFAYGDPYGADFADDPLQASVFALCVDSDGGVGFSTNFVEVEPGGSALIAPTLGSVVNLRVDGQPADEDLELDSPTPEVTWAVPSLGTAVAYSILVAGGGSNASIYTAERRIRVPPGILEPGTSYTLFAQARGHPFRLDDERVPPGSTVNRRMFPASITVSAGGD
jgi:hypothetical protein